MLQWPLEDSSIEEALNENGDDIPGLFLLRSWLSVESLSWLGTETL